MDRIATSRGAARLLAAAFFTVWLVSQPGCSEKRVVRLPVYGKISVKGDNYATGSVSFVPVGDRGPAATTSLQGGEYQFNDQDGPAAGKHKVVVSRAGGANVAEGLPDKSVEEFSCEAEVNAAGPFRQDFSFP